jgi:hypothetical protein
MTADIMVVFRVGEYVSAVVGRSSARERTA